MYPQTSLHVSHSTRHSSAIELYRINISALGHRQNDDGPNASPGSIIILIGINQILIGINQILIGINQILIGINQILIGINQILIGINQILIGINQILIGINLDFSSRLSAVRGLEISLGDRIHNASEWSLTPVTILQDCNNQPDPSCPSLA